MIRQSDKNNLKRLGLNIKKLREAKGLSFRELSYACEIDHSKISKIEKGLINITFTHSSVSQSPGNNSIRIAFDRF
jgi:ribosome-binding protein aMBF1 (putative translation factor)